VTGSGAEWRGDPAADSTGTSPHADDPAVSTGADPGAGFGLFGDDVAEPVQPSLRPLPQQQADALAELAAMALRSGMLPQRGEAPARVLLSMTLADLSGRLHTAGLLETGNTMPIADALRLACDAELVPAVCPRPGSRCTWAG